MSSEVSDDPVSAGSTVSPTDDTPQAAPLPPLPPEAEGDDALTGGGNGADVDDRTGPTTSASVEWGRVDWIACAVLVAASFLLVGLHVRAFPELSPIDELQHLDYVVKAGQFEVPATDDRIGQEAMDEAACRTIASTEYVPPECGSGPYDPRDFPAGGFSTAASQFPVYYGITGLVARAIVSSGATDSSLVAARMVGGAWLGAAWALLWYAGALIGATRVQRAAVFAVLVPTPLIVLHSATVNADALLLFTGAIGLTATLLYERQRLRWWWLVVVYLALLIAEPTNLLVIAAMCMYLLGVRYWRGQHTWGGYALPVAVLVVVLGVRARALSRLQDFLFPGAGDSAPPLPPRETGDSSFIPLAPRVEAVDLDRVLSQLPSVFTPISNTYLSDPLSSQWAIAWLQLSNWLLIGLLAIAALAYVGDRDRSTMAQVTVVTFLAAGPLYTFYYAYFSNSDFPAPGRFGLPMLGVAAIVCATAVRTKAAVGVTAAIGVCSCVTTLALLATA